MTTDSMERLATDDDDLQSIHFRNLAAEIQNNELQAMGRLFHQRQLVAKRVAETVNLLGPKGNLQIVQPVEKGLAGKRSARRQEILDNPTVLTPVAEGKAEPCLAKVPVKLDIDLDGYRLHDSLLWSINDTSITPDQFAAITCEDFELPINLFVPAITKSINEQIQEYQEYLGMLRMMGGLKEFRGIRGLIRLDVTIDGLSVVDKFEWDLGETRNDPESFAASYTKELALPIQFISAVAIDIYEQVYLLRRSLLQTGFNRDPETGQISRLHDPDLAELVAVFASSTLVNRDTNRLDEFTPLVSILDPAELEKLEQSRDREARRKRRQAKAKKVEPLSVRSPPKTMLTPLEYRGSVHRQLRLADDADGEPVPTSGRGRRRKHF